MIGSRPLRRSLIPTLALLLALIPSAALASTLPKKNDKWIRVQSPHFTLISNADKRLTRNIARELEGLRFTMTILGDGADVQSPIPTTIYVLRNSRSFRNYLPGNFSARRSLAGFFRQTSAGNFIVLDATFGEEAVSVVFHEYLHFFLGNRFPGLPLWLNEGLAEYYSNFEMDRKRNRAYLGKPIDRHVLWLRRNDLIPLERLFAVDRDSPEYNESSRVGVFYAESWALTHFFLRSSNERRALFGKYLAALSGADSVAAFKQTFKQGFKGVEEELEQYLQENSWSYTKIDFGENFLAVEPSITSLAREEYLAELGWLLAHFGEKAPQRALEHLAAVLSAESKATPAALGTARLAMGKIALDQRRYDMAIEDLKASLAAKSDSAMAEFMLGRALVQKAVAAMGGSMMLSPDPPPQISAARAHFERSVSLAPDFAPALAGLATTYTFQSRDVKAGIEAALRAWHLLPSRLDIARTLVELKIRDGDRDGAASLVEVIRAGTDDQRVLNGLDQVMLQADLAEVETLLRSQDLAGAIERLEAAIAKVENTDYRAELERRLENLRAQYRSKQLIDRFNVAIDLLNAGKYDQARAVFDEVRERGPDEAMLERIEGILEKLDAAAGGEK